MRSAGQFFVAVLAVSTPAMADDLHLVCRGSGTAIVTEVIGHADHSDVPNQAAPNYAHRSMPFEDEVSVEILDGTGRIRLPRSLLPPLHGGKEGWFELRKLKLGDTDITAAAAVNFYTAPKVRISRITGAIAIDGDDGIFSGQCQTFDPATQKRQF